MSRQPGRCVGARAQGHACECRRVPMHPCFLPCVPRSGSVRPPFKPRRRPVTRIAAAGRRQVDSESGHMFFGPSGRRGRVGGVNLAWPPRRRGRRRRSRRRRRRNGLRPQTCPECGHGRSRYTEPCSNRARAGTAPWPTGPTSLFFFQLINLILSLFDSESRPGVTPRPGSPGFDQTDSNHMTAMSPRRDTASIRVLLI
jgi:hypothetical protein